MHVQRRGEILSVSSGSKVTLYIDGEADYRTVEHHEVVRWWDLMPVVGDDPPAWVKPQAIFVSRTSVVNVAIIVTVKPGWVSFFDKTALHPHVFRMIEYSKFKEHWEPLDAPTVWQRIQDPMV